MIEVTDEMVREFTPLIHDIVRKFSRGGRRSEDFIQAGFEGLLKAAQSYNPDDESGASLGTFAYRYIWREVIAASREAGNMVVRHTTRAGRLISNRFTSAKSTLGPNASNQEIADLIGVDLEELEAWLGATTGYYTDEDSVEYLDWLAGGVEQPERLESGLRTEVARVVDLAGWGRVEKTILYTRLYTSEEPLSQSELARRLGVSRNWIWQKENECVEVLRRELAV